MLGGVKVEDDTEGGLLPGEVTPQHQPPTSPPQEISLWLHLERGGDPSSSDPECPVVVGGEQPLPPIRPMCRCPSPSLLVTTTDPRFPHPKPRRTSVKDIPRWQYPGGRVVRLRAPPSESDSAYHPQFHTPHGKWKYGKLVLLLHGLNPALLGENDDLAKTYWTLRRKGGAQPKAALVKSWTDGSGSAAAGSGLAFSGEESEVYLEPVVPSGEDEPPCLQLVYASSTAVAECYECTRSEDRQRLQQERQQRQIDAGGVPFGLERSSSATASAGRGFAAPAPAPAPKPDPVPAAHVVTPAAPSAPAPTIVGNNILSRLLDRHSRWPFGGLAELLHNSADADSSRVSVSKFPSVDSDPFSSHFALRIDDDGRGMDHDDMVRMMRIGADEGIGRDDKVGKIGGYGVGFKAGSLATAHTAVVLSSCLAKRTVSVGLLSNEPYEARHERPHVGLVATQSADTAKVDEATTTVEGKKQLMDLIVKLNPSLTPEFIGVWSGKMQGKSGTTVFLCGVRRNPDCPDKMLFEFEDKPKPDMRFLAPGSDDEPFDEFSGRFDGQVAPMDHSLRAYLSLMFKSCMPRITLFGQGVEQHDLSEELVDKRTVDLGVSGVLADVGCHPPSAAQGLSGAMLYCEGVLVESYARREFEIPREEDADRRGKGLGVLLVADLPKSTSEARTVHDSGFKPKDNKLCFDWAGKKDFRRRLKAEFLKYEDQAEAERDRRNPLRTALRKLVADVKEELARKYGPNSAGSMVGLLRLPLREAAAAEGSATHTSYFGSIADPISLQEISENIEDEKYAGDGGLKAFEEDLRRMFRNIRRWHSECRWHPDNDVDDLALLSTADDGHEEAKPFYTDNSVYTIRAICKHLDIPKAFRKAMVEGNDEYGKIDEKKTQFEVGTTILLPHHLDVAAFKDSIEILDFTLKRLKATEQTLKRMEHARQRGHRDCWLQCEKRGCHKWRRVAEEYARQFADINAKWTCDTAGSPVEGCHVPAESRPDDEVALHAAHVAGAGASASTSSAGPPPPSGGTKAPEETAAGAKRKSSNTSTRGSSSSKKRPRASPGGGGGDSGGSGGGGNGTEPPRDGGSVRQGGARKKKKKVLAVEI